MFQKITQIVKKQVSPLMIINDIILQSKNCFYSFATKRKLQSHKDFVKIKIFVTL